WDSNTFSRARSPVRPTTPGNRPKTKPALKHPAPTREHLILQLQTTSAPNTRRWPLFPRLTKLLAATLLLASSAAPNSVSNEEPLKQISGYRDWAGVTKKPVSVELSSLAG